MQMKKAVFLDRDGVINKKPPEHDYVKSVREFFLLPKSLEAIKHLKEKGYLVVVITNQRGIAKGLMTKEAVDEVHKIITDAEAFYVCPHDYVANCSCRKPKPGLILKAVNDLNINLGNSLMIGDSDDDRKAALSAGILQKNIFIIPTNGSLYKVVKGLGL